MSRNLKHIVAGSLGAILLTLGTLAANQYYQDWKAENKILTQFYSYFDQYAAASDEEDALILQDSLSDADKVRLAELKAIKSQVLEQQEDLILSVQDISLMIRLREMRMVMLKAYF